MDGARACFHQHGFHAAGTADIAAAAKVSVANLYQYFSSKDELIIAIAEEDLKSDLALLAMIQSAGSIEKALELAVEAITHEASDPSVSRLRLEVSTEATRNPGVAEIVLRAERMQRAALEDWIRQSQARGDMPADLDPASCAFALLCLIDGAFTRVATGALPPASAARELMRAIRALFRI